MSDIDTYTDPSATSPGVILKRCREYHDITLEEAAAATKIGENYLAALEDEQLKVFASQAYLKGFLRIYATYLGLSPDDMIRLYEKLYGIDRTRDERPAGTVAKAPSPRKKFPLQKLALPVFFLVLILIASAIVNRPPAPRPPAVRQAVAVPPTAAPAVQKTRSSAVQPPAAKKPVEAVAERRTDPVPPVPGSTAKNPTENPKGFIVRMRVIQSGTLTVTIDGSPSQGYELVVGDSIEWKADKNITLELSNAGGVEAELNGKQLKPFGQVGKPLVIVLDADGIRQ